MRRFRRHRLRFSTAARLEITLPEGANVHAREYKLVLPSKADLRRKLMEWTGDDGP